MAKMKYTPAQECAVFYPDGNLLLSAAAGSGKTAALTGRIVQLILDNRAELSEMLIVTFTKAAAGEMKTRISKMLREKMEEYKTKDQQIVSRLSRALSQIPSADISTIHSFLYQALKPYFPALHLSQDTTIGEPQEMDELKTELMRDVVDDFFSARDGEKKEAFVVLADTIGQARDTTAIDEELLWLAERLESMGKDVSVLEEYANELEQIANLKADPFDTKYGDVILHELRVFTAHFQRVFEEFAFEFEGESVTAEKYGAALGSIRDWLNTLEHLLRENPPSFEQIGAHFRNYAPEKLGRLMKKDATETSENFKKFREALKKEVAGMRGEFFGADIGEFHRTAEGTARILRTARLVLAEYRKRLEQKKQSLSIIEYGDLEAYGTRLFTDENGKATAAAEEIGAKYKYIFVDEYQDTNRIQDEIFKKVVAHSVRFMVGDIKQSIYRFRGADPRVFSEYRRSWEKVDVHATDADVKMPGGSVFMSENFRCSRDIITFINAVSRAILPYGGIPYEEEDALIYGKAEGETTVPVEVILLDRKSGEGEESSETEAVGAEKVEKNVNVEAVYVAQRIRDMIGRYSEDGSRIIKPSDIAVLLRSPGSNGAEYRKALEELGVQAVTKTAKPLGDFASVLLLLCLLKFIDNPLRDIYAAGAMKSSIFDFSVEDIIHLRQQAGELPLYTAVLDLTGMPEENADTELVKKCRRLIAFLEEEKTLLNGISIEKYLENLLNRTDFMKIEEIRSNASERDAVQKVIGAARTFANSATGQGNKSLHAFTEYLDEWLEQDMDTTDTEAAEAVSIISIHASKGLEYPVCFLCETAKKRNRADEIRTILFDDTLGFGMQLPDSTGLIKCDNLIRRAISRKMANESMEEEMRMLYVALTRAQGKLIVTAKVDNAEEWLAEKAVAQEFADEHTVKGVSSYIDWIAAGIIKYKQHRSWNIHVVDCTSPEAGKETLEHAEETEAALDIELTRAIAQNYAFQYQYDFLEKIPSKLVVSRLQPEILDEEAAAEKVYLEEQVEEPKEFTFRKPSFMLNENTAKANEIGNATHRFLQFVNYAKLAENGFDSEKKRLTEAKFISYRDAEIVNRSQIEKFIKSRLFRELLESEMIRREFRFNVLVDAAAFTADAEWKQKLEENQVKITVQGVVDCVYREKSSGKLVLIDYKTDSIHADEWQDLKKAESRLREKHRSQLSYYQKICSEMFEEEIEEAYIYATVLGRCIEI